MNVTKTVTIVLAHIHVLAILASHLTLMSCIVMVMLHVKKHVYISYCMRFKIYFRY